MIKIAGNKREKNVFFQKKSCEVSGKSAGWRKPTLVSGHLWHSHLNHLQELMRQNWWKAVWKPSFHLNTGCLSDPAQDRERKQYQAEIIERTADSSRFKFTRPPDRDYGSVSLSACIGIIGAGGNINDRCGLYHGSTLSQERNGGLKVNKWSSYCYVAVYLIIFRISHYDHAYWCKRVTLRVSQGV